MRFVFFLTLLMSEGSESAEKTIHQQSSLGATSQTAQPIQPRRAESAVLVGWYFLGNPVDGWFSQLILNPLTSTKLEKRTNLMELFV